MFDSRCAKPLKTSVQIFGLSLHREDLLPGRGNGGVGIDDAEGAQKPVSPRRATADRALGLALTERHVDDADGLERLQGLLAGAQRDRHLLVYLDEAHIHQDTDLGYGWAPRGERFSVASSSPGLSAKVSFYGLYFYNEGEVRLWPYPRANGAHTIDVLRRLRAEYPDENLIVLWDRAPWHRAKAVRAETVRNGDRRVHQIRLLSSEGKVWTVRVDAESGAMN